MKLGFLKRIPKFLGGIAVAVAGCAVGQVPFLQPVSAFMVKTGLGLSAAGLVAKGIRAAKAPKGTKMVAVVTEHERELIKALRKEERLKRREERRERRKEKKNN